MNVFCNYKTASTVKLGPLIRQPKVWTMDKELTHNTDVHAIKEIILLEKMNFNLDPDKTDNKNRACVHT